MHKNQPAARVTVPTLLRTALAIALMSLASTAAAQIYQCTNAKGQKEYSQHCAPDTVQRREVVTGAETTAPAAGGPAPAKPLDQQDAEFRKRQLERQETEAKAAQQKAQAEEAERYCTSARAQLKAIQDGQRLVRTDPVTGERVQFGDEERAAESARQLKVIEQWCK